MTEFTQASGLPVPLSAGSIDQYINHVYQVPVLEFEQEQALARAYRDHEDLDAARDLVLAHLRFVVHVARGYGGYGLQLSDLIQEGNIGLMKAVKRFDPEQGVRLVSFAVHWIRAEMHEFILRNWRIVKVATTKAQRKLFFNLRKSKQRLGWLNQEEVRQVAHDLGVKPEVVLEMESRLSGQDIGFDLSADDDNDSGPRRVAPVNWLEDQNNDDPEATLLEEDGASRHHQMLVEGLDALDERSRVIMQRRWLTDDKATLQELADEYGVSAERIRQIEAAALKELRGSMAA